MDFESLLKLVTENPITASALGAFAAAAVAFFKPVMRALQRALVRRIDQAWPDNGGHEERIRKTIDTVTSETVIPLPRSLVDRVIRDHKSTPMSPHSPEEG